MEDAHLIHNKKKHIHLTKQPQLAPHKGTIKLKVIACVKDSGPRNTLKIHIICNYYLDCNIGVFHLGDNKIASKDPLSIKRISIKVL